jgi:hypothetical protein
VWDVRYHEEAEQERNAMPATERVALEHATDKLATFGPHLPFPHQSRVQSVKDLRELRPRAGRSAWRVLYRRSGDVFVIAAVGPEAESGPRGFKRTVSNALRRLQEVEID